LSVIDGIADFIGSVNDEEEANNIVSFFEHLAIKYNTAIILILHLNPGSDKERGHLGSQLQRKSESVLTIKKEGDISILEAKLLRSGATGDFTPIRYQFNQEKGYHVFMEAGNGCDNQKLSKLRDLARFVFTEKRKYADAVKIIQEYEVCGVRTAKDRITKLNDAGILERTEIDSAVYYSLKTIEDVPF